MCFWLPSRGWSFARRELTGWETIWNVSQVFRAELARERGLLFDQRRLAIPLDRLWERLIEKSSLAHVSTLVRRQSRRPEDYRQTIFSPTQVESWTLRLLNSYKHTVKKARARSILLRVGKLWQKIDRKLHVVSSLKRAVAKAATCCVVYWD